MAKAWLPPKQWERRYKRFVGKTIAAIQAEFVRRLGEIERIKKEVLISAGLEETEDDEIDLEEKSNEINILIAGLLIWWNSQIPTVRATISGYYGAVNQFNDKQFQAVVKDVAGVKIPPSYSAPYEPGRTVSPTQDLIDKFGNEADIFRQEPYLQGVKSNWIDTQETYIDKLAKDGIGNGELVVRNGFVTAASTVVISDAVNRVFDTVSKRGQRGADEGINNLNAQLAQKRQQSLGATEYVWQTMWDERVRGNPGGLYPNAKPSHWEREGKTFSWSNPPEGGHPGQAINCRCIAVLKLPRG